MGGVAVFALAVTLVYVRHVVRLPLRPPTGLVLLVVATRLKPAVSETLLAALGATKRPLRDLDVASDVLLRHSGRERRRRPRAAHRRPGDPVGAAWIVSPRRVLVSVLRRLA